MVVAVFVGVVNAPLAPRSPMVPDAAAAPALWRWLTPAFATDASAAVAGAAIGGAAGGGGGIGILGGLAGLENNEPMDMPFKRLEFRTVA